jgi:hypothetical protein
MKKMRNSMNIKTISYFIVVLTVSWLIPCTVGANDRELELYGECPLQESYEGNAEFDWLAANGKKPIVVREHDSSDSQSLGRDYYKSLVEQAIERTWALPITIYYQFISDAFDNDGQSTTHPGGVPTIQDIYLFSKLCYDNLVRIENIPSPGFQRTVPPVGQPGLPFGDFADDEYTTLLAPTEVLMNNDEQEAGAIISLIHRFDLGDSRLMQAGIGISIPLKVMLVTTDVHFAGGYLFSANSFTGQIQREDSLMQFYQEFIDIFDFFQTAILEPKGLSFVGHQSKVGVGDTSLFGYLEFARYFEHVSSFQLGVNLIAPTGGKPKSDGPLFAPTLGNGGAFQCDFFGNLQFITPLSSFNPTVRAAVQVSAPVTSYQRMPQVKTQSVAPRVLINTVPDLYTPKLFQAFYVDTYSQLDTTFPAFADAALSVRTMTGPKALISVGNYFYNLFDIAGLRLGIVYTYMHKWKDKVLSQCGSATSATVSNSVSSNGTSTAAQVFTAGTSANSQTLDWLLAYQFDSMVELNIGYRGVFAGKNVPRTREIYGSIVLTF